jgi:hypothetical protein
MWEEIRDLLATTFSCAYVKGHLSVLVGGAEFFTLLQERPDLQDPRDSDKECGAYVVPAFLRYSTKSTIFFIQIFQNKSKTLDDPHCDCQTREFRD